MFKCGSIKKIIHVNLNQSVLTTVTGQNTQNNLPEVFESHSDPLVSLTFFSFMFFFFGGGAGIGKTFCAKS